MPSLLRYIVFPLTILLSGSQMLFAQTVQELITEYNNTTDKDHKISLLVKLGLSYQNIRAYPKALTYYEEALELYKEGNSFTEKTFILKNAALCQEAIRDYDKALNIWKEILHEKKIGQEKREIVMALEKLSNLSVQKNNYRDAISYSLEMLPLYLNSKDKAGLAGLYNNLGAYYKKTGDLQRSLEYFSLCREMIDKKDSDINENDLASILLNLGVTHTVQGEVEEANRHFSRVLAIREKQNKPVEIANVLNYMAATDLLLDYYEPARQKVEKALQLLEKGKNEPAADEVQIASYRIYCELLLRKKKIKEFKIYNELYNAAKDRLIEKEQKQNFILFEQQVEIEKMESEFRLMRADKEMKEAAYRQSELEKEKREKELIIQAKEIELLRQSRDLQQSRIRNQELDRQRIAHLLELSSQRSASLEQEREIEVLQKNKELQMLTIEKQARENKILEIEKQSKDLKYANEATTRKYTYGLLVLLLAVVFVTFLAIWMLRRNNMLLARQNTIIRDSNEKIVMQNRALSDVNQELKLNRENLERQNKELENAKHTIDRQNDELKKYTLNLEDEVNKRTSELIAINKQLIRNNSQLEQFGYVVSHNLRGPIARLLGLSNVINRQALSDEDNTFLNKITDVTKDLDLIIHDLNQILEVKQGAEQELVMIDVEDRLTKLLVRLENKIQESGAVIFYDFAAVKEIKSISPYFESILYNLVINAIKYAKPGGNPEIHISTSMNKDFNILTITDNGVGLDTERHKEKLFGLYKRFHTHVDGKGLGLYMVKTQIEAMNGKIEVDSKPNEGSTFRVYFRK